MEFFQDGDNRSGLLTVRSSKNKSAKYPSGGNDDNAKVLRLAEIYLIRSEAAVFKDNNHNAGISDLNMLRERAGLPPIQSLRSHDVYIDALLYERRAELNFEGHRFFDLVRLEKSGEILNLEDFRKILAIPKEELQVSEALIPFSHYICSKGI